MAEFEEACVEIEVPLAVLPPPASQLTMAAWSAGIGRFVRNFIIAPNLLADSIGAVRFDLTKLQKNITPTTSSGIERAQTYRIH